MVGKTVLVTGATSGIGREIARGLAKKGAAVILGARDEQRGRRVRDAIVDEVGNNNISVMGLDVASRSSIRAFADAFRGGHDRLDVLVNNAGAWFAQREESEDGIELTWATNVLGPYLLVRELQDSLKKGAPSRIVNLVSSVATDYDPSDLEFRKRAYHGFKAYAQSKLALRMLTWWQAKWLEGSNVTANAVSPGFVRTDFMKHTKGMMATLIKLSAPLFAITPEKGAETPIWVASAPELEKATAQYYEALQAKPRKFRDGLGELARICEHMTTEHRAA